MLATAMTGCIRNDDSDLDCERTRIHFCYYGDTPDQCRLLDKVDNLYLYVYDQEGNLVRQLNLSNTELTAAGKSVKMNLPNGEYTLVVWGNNSDNSKVSGESKLSDAKIGCASHTSGQTPRQNDALYFGSKKITVVQSTYRDETVMLTSRHIPIAIYVAGAPAPSTRAGASVSLKMHNMSAVRSFATGGCAGKACFEPEFVWDATKSIYTTSVNALRFDNNTDIEVELLNGDGTVSQHTLQLAVFMTTNSIDVTSKDEVSVNIQFTFSGATVTVKPWVREGLDPGFE